MLSGDKSGLLRTLLGNLPGAMAARLAKAVEVDRLMDGSVLPHSDILSSLRPALRDDNLERTPTPLRLFCQPFQDLLTSAPRLKKQKAVIARASVLPLWQWLSQTLMPAVCAAYMIETKAAILARQFETAAKRAHEFRAAAAAAIQQALSGEQGRNAARSLLGGDLVLADAQEIALLLSADEAVLRIHALIPHPASVLDEKLLWDLRDVHDGLLKSRPDAAPYVAAIVMNRLMRPWEALKLPMMISRSTDDTLISQTDMGLVGEILISRLDGLQASIRATRHPYFDVEKLIQDVRCFAQLSSAMVKEIEIRRGGEWGQRLLKDRQAVGDVMDEFMERAAKEFVGALPMGRGPGATAEFGRPVEPAKHELARRYARLVSGCRDFAANASFAARQKTACDEMGAYLRRYNEDVVKGLRETDPGRRAIAEQQYALCADLTAELFSLEEGELLRRRGRAALGTEQAA